MKTNAMKFLMTAAGFLFVHNTAWAECEPTEHGTCCVESDHRGQCIEEVDCSSCSNEPAPSPDPEPEPLPDEPFPGPSCGDMGAC